MDPFVDLIRLLRPQATLWTRIEAAGRWGMSFRQREDTLFCWMQSGECQLLRPGAASLLLLKDDFALVRTSTPFTLTSDPASEAVDKRSSICCRRKQEHTTRRGVVVASRSPWRPVYVRHCQ
jgi:hypothetical protein